jgi:phage shock protein PspC (stress-responsive transcriptional regulator)
MVTFVLGTQGVAGGLGSALQAGRSWVRFLLVSLEFFIDIILPASKKNEYQEYFLGVRTAGA